MADAAFLTLPGISVSSDALTIPIARDVADYLQSGANQYAHFVEALRQADESEVLIVDLSIEVGQTPVNDIRPNERVALVFSRTDSLPLEVLSLRNDFPLVPHLSIRDTEFPRGLCLYEILCLGIVRASDG